MENLICSARTKQILKVLINNYFRSLYYFTDFDIIEDAEGFKTFNAQHNITEGKIIFKKGKFTFYHEDY